jgi:hypothetical protein
MPWSASPILDEDWKVSIASNMLDSLSESKYIYLNLMFLPQAC